MFQQPIYNSITLIIHVCACETLKGISSEKYVLYKNTAAAGVGFTTVGVLSVCVYIFYTARGDQVKYNSLFGKREGWGVWSSCGRILLLSDK